MKYIEDELMKNIKNKLITVGLIITLFIAGCSSKNPSVRTGAIAGGTAGVVVGGFFGMLAGGGVHGGNEGGMFVGALMGATLLGLFGTGIGAGFGYAIDSVSNNDKEIQTLIQSDKMMHNMK